MSAVMSLVTRAEAAVGHPSCRAAGQPIEVTSGYGWIRATGPVESLIEEGLCTRAHLPLGQRRLRRENIDGAGPIESWSVRLLRGGCASLTVWYRGCREHENAKEDARAKLDAVPRTEAAWRERAHMCMGVGTDMVARAFDVARFARGGYRLADGDRERLEEIGRQVAALLARAQVVVANAKPCFDAAEQARIIAELEECASPRTMPPLPAPRAALRAVSA